MDLWALAQKFLLRKWSFAGEVCTFALVCTGCIKRRKADPEKKLNPLFDLVTAFLATFATGTVGPLAVGEIPLWATNDLNITCLIVLWILFYRFEIFAKVASLPGIYQALHFFATLSRANNICVFTDKAFNRLNPYAGYYPIALFGPIIVSVLRGSGGNFYPFDQGLSKLQNGVPLNTQIALMAGITWHVLIHDPFVLGGFARGLLFGVDVTPELLRSLIVLFFLIVNVLWTIPGWETFSPFAPLWSALSYVTGIGYISPKGSNDSNKPRLLYDLKARQRIQTVYDIARVCFILAMGGIFISNQLPKSMLFPGQSLQSGDYLGSCTFMPALRSCDPTILVMEPEGSLTLYRGQYPSDPSKQQIWSSGFSKNKNVGEWSAVMKDDGVLSVETAQGRRSWSTRLKWGASRARNVLVKGVVENGSFSIYKGDANVWSTP